MNRRGFFGRLLAGCVAALTPWPLAKRTAHTATLTPGMPLGRVLAIKNVGTGTVTIGPNTLQPGQIIRLSANYQYALEQGRQAMIDSRPQLSVNKLSSVDEHMLREYVLIEQLRPLIYRD